MSTTDRIVLCIEGGASALQRAGYLRAGAALPASVFESVLDEGVQLTRLPDGRLRLIMSQQEAARRDLSYRRFLRLALAPVDVGPDGWPSGTEDGDDGTHGGS